MSYNFVADSFHTTKLCNRLCSSEENENGSLRFSPFPLVGLSATYDDHLIGSLESA